MTVTPADAKRRATVITPSGRTATLISAPPPNGERRRTGRGPGAKARVQFTDTGSFASIPPDQLTIADEAA